MGVPPAASVTNAQAPWQKIADVADDVTSFDFRGSTIYLLSHKNASNFKVLATSLASPDLTAAQTIVAPSRAVVEQIGVAADGLYVRSRVGGFGRIARLPLDDDGKVTGAEVDVTMPFTGSLITMITDPRVAGTTFGLTGWTHTLLYYRNDAMLAVVRTDLKPPSPFNASAYTSEEVQAPSADGTLVPLSILYRKGIMRDGSHPTYLEGYGAYGTEVFPDFETGRFAWLERSGVYAVCHVRGGGWYGEDWHRAGMLDKKQNVFDDFIAAGEYLIAQKYTDRDHLAIEGGSNGGLLMGAMITQRPDLFRAVVCAVPLLDMFRYQNFQIAKLWVPEYGSADDPKQFDWLYAYSPYHHVKAGVEYPAILFMTGDTDTRVDPMHAKKMAALMQAEAKNGASKDKPILLRIETKAGHGQGKPLTKQIEESTDMYSFLFWQLGVKP